MTLQVKCIQGYEFQHPYQDSIYTVSREGDEQYFLAEAGGLGFPKKQFAPLEVEEDTKVTEVRGLKFDDKKPDFSLIPEIALIEEASALMIGEVKYERYNYTKGLELNRVMAGLLRHAFRYLAGEDRCPVDGQHHLGSIRACAAMILHNEELGTLIDNRNKSDHAVSQERIDEAMACVIAARKKKQERESA